MGPEKTVNNGTALYLTIVHSEDWDDTHWLRKVRDSDSGEDAGPLKLELSAYEQQTQVLLGSHWSNMWLLGIR